MIFYHGCRCEGSSAWLEGSVIDTNVSFEDSYSVLLLYGGRRRVRKFPRLRVRVPGDAEREELIRGDVVEVRCMERERASSNVGVVKELNREDGVSVYRILYESGEVEEEVSRDRIWGLCVGARISHMLETLAAVVYDSVRGDCAKYFDAFGLLSRELLKPMQISIERVTAVAALKKDEMQQLFCHYQIRKFIDAAVACCRRTGQLYEKTTFLG